MKHSMNRLFAAAALLACFACAKTETDINNVMNDELGDFVYIAPIVEDDVPDTRAYKKSDWSYHFEVGDRIAIWDDLDVVMNFKVSEVLGNDHAKIDGGHFHLDDGVTYWSTFPYVHANTAFDRNAQVYTYEGQTQTDQNLTDGKLTELAKFAYNWASATRENGSSSFEFKRLSTYFRVVATLPEAGMTIKEIAVTADKNVFDLNGTFDLTTGTLIPDGNYTNTIKMTLNNVTVNGNVITAYFASNPLEAANYVISITDSHDKVYKSIKVAKGARAAGGATAFVVDVAPEGGYVKLTSMPADPAGKYILVYPDGTTYRAFSFGKTMENAEAAAASVSDVAFTDLYDQASTLYNRVIGGNYVEITGEANATTLTLTDEQEAAAAITIAANAAPWTVTAPAKDLQTTLTSGSYSIGVDHIVTNVASDGKADLVAAFNAPDAVAIMNSLRGHDVNVTFADLINLAVAKTEGLNSTDAALFRLAFEKFVSAANSLVAENPHNLFPEGSSLMNMDVTTNAFTVFSQYYDNAAEISWRINPERRFGLAQLGYNVNAQGFTVSVNMPSYIWFSELNTAISTSSGQTAKFVDYWKKFDNDSQYDVCIDGVKIENFYTKLAQRFVTSLGAGQYRMLYFMLGNQLTLLGQAYKTLAEKLNTGIQPAYIYKKVE